MSFAIVLRPEAGGFFATVFDQYVTKQDITVSDGVGVVAYVAAARIDFSSPGFVAAIQQGGGALLIPTPAVAAIWEGGETRSVPSFLAPAAPAPS